MEHTLLHDANIPQELWEHCYVSENSEIFSPRMDDKGTVIATGYEVYEELKAQKHNPITPSPPDLQKRTGLSIKNLLPLFMRSRNNKEGNQ